MISYETVYHIPRAVRQCMRWASRPDCAFMRLHDLAERKAEQSSAGCVSGPNSASDTLVCGRLSLCIHAISCAVMEEGIYSASRRDRSDGRPSCKREKGRRKGRSVEECTNPELGIRQGKYQSDSEECPINSPFFTCGQKPRKPQDKLPVRSGRASTHSREILGFRDAV